MSSGSNAYFHQLRDTTLEGSQIVNRIVFVIATGQPKFAESALGLGRSLKLIGDTIRRVVVTDMPQYPWDKSFDLVLEPEAPHEWTMMSKLSALERTNADQILSVDGDSLAFKRLDPIFDYCQGKGFCVQGYRIKDGDWYGDVKSHLLKLKVDEMPKFNGGMMYYERTSECRHVIESAFLYARRAEETGFEYGRQMIPDEPYVSSALAAEGIDRPGVCHLIPETADYTSSATGLIGKLELDVMRNRCQFVCRRHDLRFTQPYLFHASRYINFTIYWKQLDRLRDLEKYEAEHEAGYMSPWHRLQRSVQRRYLKYIRRDRPR